jgi:hypothetical protein
MLFKNSVRTSKRTPHFTITKINWLTLFKFKVSGFCYSCILIGINCAVMSWLNVFIQHQTYCLGGVLPEFPNWWFHLYFSVRGLFTKLLFPSIHPMALQPKSGLGLLLWGFLITHRIRHTVGLLWTSDQTRRRGLYLHRTYKHKRQTSMPLAGFEPAIPATKRPQTDVLDRAATEVGKLFTVYYIFVIINKLCFVFNTCFCKYSLCLPRSVSTYKVSHGPIIWDGGRVIRKIQGPRTTAASTFHLKTCSKRHVVRDNLRQRTQDHKIQTPVLFTFSTVNRTLLPSTIDCPLPSTDSN